MSVLLAHEVQTHSGKRSPWAIVRLADVLLQQKREVTVDAAEEYRVLGAHWYAKGLYVKDTKPGSQIKAAKLYRVEQGDFVYNRLFAWKGSFAVADSTAHGCYVSNEFPTFTVKRDRVDSAFLWWYFSRQSAWDDALGVSYGATPTSRNRLKERDLLGMELPLPSVDEQRRIVAKIERLAAKIDEARGIREFSIREVQALLASTYDACFTPAKGWNVLPVSAFCEKPQYGFTASATTEPLGPQMVRITDIQGGQVQWDGVPYCLCPEPEPYLLQENDILFARTGATTGKSFLIGECPNAVFASYLIRLRIKSDVTPDYLYAFFQTPNYWQQIADNKTGTGQPNCNGTKLAAVQVPVPPESEQHRIVAYLDSLQAKADRIKALQQKTAAELDALLPSILDKAFKGEL